MNERDGAAVMRMSGLGVNTLHEEPYEVPTDPSLGHGGKKCGCHWCQKQIGISSFCLMILQEFRLLLRVSDTVADKVVVL